MGSETAAAGAVGLYHVEGVAPEPKEKSRDMLVEGYQTYVYNGAAELITVWKDPQFDSQQHAFYYARVIEIPTPRWTAYEAKRFGVEMSEGVPMVTQERAYTSPIWFSP